MKIHNESVHEGKKPHKCSTCSRNSDLKKHTESVHDGKKSHWCSICDKKNLREVN